MFPGAGEQIDAMVSPRIAQIPTFARLPFTRDPDPRVTSGVFLGVPFDGGVTYYSGARLGPTYIRIESRLLRPYNHALKIYPFKVLGAVDYGDIDVIPTSVEKTLNSIEETIRDLDSKGITPFIAGGDHSISLGVLRGLSRHKPILIHFDSHLDYWDQYWGGERYTHGTWVKRAIEEGIVSSVVQIGIRGPQYSEEDLKFPEKSPVPLTIITMDEVAYYGVTWLTSRLKSLKGKIYVSIDIDVVDPAFAPGTGTREVGGFTPRELISILRSLSEAEVEMVGIDVVEVSPPLDHTGITSLLAANLIYEAMSVKAVQTARKNLIQMS
ncbi:hypothetical protein ATG_06990 [Desulfurococcaceae archaeon AG1]|jgi:agmatinase|nr:MAG: agmatinase [Desulfurococcaceae archaeon]GAY25496.1 hypothetical protein ATG_06990 [Desulfurococcaceae archaeon AG1]